MSNTPKVDRSRDGSFEKPKRIPVHRGGQQAGRVKRVKLATRDPRRKSR